jgi:hypothetical protein
MPDASVNKEQIKKCLGLVENQVGFGPVDQWTHRNFESLSKEIELKTGTLLSVSTLKRVWNSNFKRLPQKATLDAIVQFIGYKDWFDFVSSSIRSRPSHFQRNMILTAGSVVILGITGVVLIPIFTGSESKDNVNTSKSLIEIEEGNVPIQEADSTDLMYINKEDLKVE